MSDTYELPILDYYNFEYFRVKNEDLKEYKSLSKSIWRYSKQKKAIPSRITNRLFFLLQNVREQQFLRYDVKRLFLTDQMLTEIQDNDKFWNEFLLIKTRIGVIKNAKANKKKYHYLYKYYEGFYKMIWHVVEGLKEIRKDNRKPFSNTDCIREAFKIMEKYREEHMSINEQEHYSGNYKLCALAAMTTEKVFEFTISKVKNLTVKDYADCAMNIIIKVQKDKSKKS